MLFVVDTVMHHSPGIYSISPTFGNAAYGSAPWSGIASVEENLLAQGHTTILKDLIQRAIGAGV